MFFRSYDFSMFVFSVISVEIFVIFVLNAKNKNLPYCDLEELLKTESESESVGGYFVMSYTNSPKELTIDEEKKEKLVQWIQGYFKQCQ